MQITCIWRENMTSNWNVKCMLRDKGNMRRGKKYACFRRPVRPTISEVVKGWWGKGLGDFEKYIHVRTVYPGSTYRVRKESCISALSKKTPHAPTVSWKKKPARDVPWVDSMKLMIFRKNGASLELLNIHLFLKIVYQKGFFGYIEKIDFFDLAPDSRYFLTTDLKRFWERMIIFFFTFG